MRTLLGLVLVGGLRCGELAPVPVRPQTAAVVSTTICSMTAPGRPQFGYSFTKYTDLSASGSCTVDGVQATFVTTAKSGGIPQTACAVRTGGDTYVFNEGTGLPSVWVSVTSDSDSNAWMVYRFGPVDSTVMCPGGANCAQVACGVAEGHCVVAGTCQTM